MEYIYPAWSIIVCISFAALLSGVKLTPQIDSDDAKGLRWFIIAFYLWALLGIISIIKCYYSWENQKLAVSISAIVSTLNSFCFLKAIQYIKIKGSYREKKFVDNMTVGYALHVLTFILLVITCVLPFLIDKDSGNVSFIWIPDTLFSLLSIFILATVVYRAFKEREMPQFQWLIISAIFFLFITILIEVIPDSFFNKNTVSALKAIVSSSYKTILCMLILILLYSWQILGATELQKEKSRIQQENENLLMQLQLISGEREEINTEMPLYNVIEFIWDSQGDSYGIKLGSDKNDAVKEIKFSPNIGLFKRFFKLAIHKKYGVDEIAQSMPYNDGKQKPKNLTDMDINSPAWIEYYQDFRTKDKHILLNNFKNHRRDLENMLLHHNKHISLSLAPENIKLPSLTNINNLDKLTPHDFFKKYCEEYPFLKALRG